MPSNHLILCCPLLLLPSIFPSIRVFSNESALCIRWSKYWSFSVNISPSDEHPGLISFMMGWWDLLAVQGTLKSLQQTQSKKKNCCCRFWFYLIKSSPSLKLLPITQWFSPWLTLRLTYGALKKSLHPGVMCVCAHAC